ncbi:ribbon-helix-helix domain-containing protein [Azospirillum sp. Sh1]|uniref:ribbon-helix-helix domain-containing protein n=1 Tax=Azospirillum sp. Sh1 TaxID=2607285 RepID=UPI0011ECB314|nr:ribbon-helix-helix domain-containing protein [Azospirillum sp. Sh1]KAA0577535.1 ribbon-helix-helix domain-containing protein [Azospirillum sp. Sh1]
MSSEGNNKSRVDQFTGVASLTSRTLKLSGRDVTIRLEPSYWEGLEEICRREDLTVDELCYDVRDRMEQQGRRSSQAGVSLANALRVFVVGYFRQAATERGHARAGHGQGRPFIATPFDIVPVTSDS